MKVNKLRRLEVLKEIHHLLILSQQGKNVDEELRECGRQLGWTDLPEQLDTTEYAEGLKLCLQNGIPEHVFKNRRRRGISTLQAATKPYNPHNQHVSNNPDQEHIERAETNGISFNSFYHRKKRGWTNEQAATLPLGTRLSKKNR